jgi:hypothetical protein
MREIEAIQNLKKWLDEHGHMPGIKWLVQAIKVAIDALEKQVPKRVTHEATLIRCCTCPNCKNVVDKFERFGDSKVRVTYNYCHFCGQRLEW